MQNEGDRIRVLLVEDHVLVRVGLRVLLERTGTIHVVDEAGTASMAMTLVMKHKPDVVLLDVKLPDRSGVDICREIRAAFPQTRVLFLSALDDIETLRSSMIGGAAGYLHKTIAPDLLVEAIKTVASGNGYLDNAAANSVRNWLRRSASLPAPGVATQLSPQERRVIALVADGKTNKEIGVALCLSEKTVKNYISHAFDKLGVTRRAQAAAIFVKTVSQTSVLSN